MKIIGFRVIIVLYVRSVLYHTAASAPELVNLKEVKPENSGLLLVWLGQLLACWIEV